MIRKREVPSAQVVPAGEKGSAEKRLDALEHNQKIILDRLEKGLDILRLLSGRSEGMFAALYAGSVISRERHALYAGGFAKHDVALNDIRLMKTVAERVQAAKRMNEAMVQSGGKPPSFLVYLEDLNLIELLRDALGKPTISQDEAAGILESGVPYTVYIETFFREVYGLEVVSDDGDLFDGL